MGSVAESGMLKLSYSPSRVGLRSVRCALATGYDFRMRKVIVRIVAAVVLLVAAVAAGAYVYQRQSLPDFDEDATVQGLTGDVDIVRDADAIPHIFAANKLDGLFGLGYVHAQDRLWQMEFQRRVGHGRLSEIFGSRTF